MVPTSGGTQSPGALRRLNEPRRVDARPGEDGAPEALRRNDRWLEVLEVQDRYRTEDRWWTGEPIARTYYDLLLEDGRTLTVFRDDARGGWWEQRYE